ncbi:ATP-dependent protease [Tolypothrix campylonemoides VB511288]|nr:ATP-dependent protease [Tolypothrix campylonemoides VB511288]
MDAAHDDTAPGSTTPLALFPLHTVLLPGARLGLRVFEPRYLDLVRECGRLGRGFGVCLILEGEEVGAAAVPAAFGTEAVIEDFGATETGLLTLQVRGARRFHVERVRVRDNGLQVADVQWRPEDPADPLRAEHGLLATVLERVLDHVGGEHARAGHARFDEAAWVGWRLAELLPLQDPQRQELLQLDDPHERLDRLLALMP